MGDTVKISIPDAALLHMLVYIVKINENHISYQLVTKYGILDGWQSRNMFQICKKKLTKFKTIDLSVTYSLRKLNGLHSLMVVKDFKDVIVQANVKESVVADRMVSFATQNAIKIKIDLLFK